LFVKAQIAGDLLEKSAGRPLRPVWVCLRWDPGTTKSSNLPKPAPTNVMTRRVLTRGFLGLTVACARCHDHKYDPIPTKDYYAVRNFCEYGSQGIPSGGRRCRTAWTTSKKDHRKGRADQEDPGNERIGRGKLSKDLSSYLLAGAAGAKTTALDSETTERFRKYLAAPEKSHPFLAEWDRLKASAPARIARPLAESFQALVEFFSSRDLDASSSSTEFHQRLKLSASGRSDSALEPEALRRSHSARKG